MRLFAVLTCIVFMSIAATCQGDVIRDTAASALLNPDTHMDTFIGFMATASDNYDYVSGERIRFNQVRLNAGSAYDSGLYVFTCPVSGYYLFSVTVASTEKNRDYGRIDAQIVVGGTVYLKAVATESPDDLTQGSIFSVYYCATGDQVYAEASCSDERGVYGGVHSAFAGYLISNTSDYVGFMATASGNYEYYDEERIRFDTVRLNEGDNYDGINYEFNCTSTGYYLFSVTVASTLIGVNFGRIDAELHVGGDFFVKAIAEESEDDITQRSIIGVYECAANEKAYVQASIGSNQEGVYGSTHSAFSGYLISTSAIVGFTATASQNRNYIDNEIIKFDVAHVNAGGAYDAVSSIFTCPSSGYYLFAVTVANDQEGFSYERIDAEIVVDGTVYVKALARESGDGITQGSALGVYRCEVSQTVYARANVASESRAVYGTTHSSFTGFLISAEA